MSRFKVKVLGFLGFIIMLSVFRVSVVQAADNDLFRWDIIHVDFSHMPPELTAGGHTSATALDGSSITITGSGTFRSGKPHDVTGGGTWSTSTGGSGNYEVTRFVSFIKGASPIGEGLDDDVCDACTLANSQLGLAVLKVAFDDGSEGVLTISCAPEPQGPVFEGITVSKGVVDYFGPDPGDPGNGNATEFHHLD